MASETQKFRIKARVSPGNAGARLDQVAARLFPDFSRARLQKWIRSGELTVDGRAVKPTYRLNGHEQLELDAAAPALDQVAPQDIALDIIHRDDDLLVLNKPAGLVVHPAAGHLDGTLQNALLFHDVALDALPRSGIVHRLDKDTSGVMVVARSLRAHTSLVNQLQARTMSRDYLAVAVGEIVLGGRVEAAIGRHPRDRKKMAVVPAGKPAVSHYRVIHRTAAATSLKVSLETGRTHQIRVHLQHIGHPLVGDPVYGRKPRAVQGVSDDLLALLREFPRQALHAHELKLVHPGTSEPVSYLAPPPDDIEGLLQALAAETR